jgi:hypothetical protein
LPDHPLSSPSRGKAKGLCPSALPAKGKSAIMLQSDIPLDSLREKGVHKTRFAVNPLKKTKQKDKGKKEKESGRLFSYRHILLKGDSYLAGSNLLFNFLPAKTGNKVDYPFNFDPD